MKWAKYANKFDPENRVLFPFLDVNPDFCQWPKQQKQKQYIQHFKNSKKSFWTYGMSECCTMKENYHQECQ